MAMIKPYDKVRINSPRFQSEGVPSGSIGFVAELWDDGNLEVEVPLEPRSALVTPQPAELELLQTIP
jgi:hypothetical protein